MKNYFISFFVLAFCLLTPLQAAEPDFFTVTNTHTSQTLTVQLKRGSYAPTNVTLNYRLIDAQNNVGAWQTLTTVNNTTNYTLADIPAGARMQLYGNNPSGFAQGTMKYWKFYFGKTGAAVLSGELMSVFSGTETSIDITKTLPNYAFYGLFYENSANNPCLISAGNLKLSATNLGQYCYNNMFNYCANMKDAPALPATTLQPYCYQSMFGYCTSLTEAPVLPATTLANYCYSYMFSGCSALKSAPSLPATTLTEGCYQYMFQNCTSLTDVQEALPATNMPQFCYRYMFSGCTALTTAPEIMAAADAAPGQGACDNMFADCSSLTKAPSKLLPATLGKNMTYSHMFYNCPNLEEGPDVYASNITASNPLQYMYHSSPKLRKIRVYFQKWGSMSFCSSWTYNVATMGAFYCPPELERTHSSTTYWNKIPLSTNNPWTVFSYNLTYIPVGGEWPKGGTDPQQYTWQTDTNYVQGWMRELDAAGAAYYHDEACTQQFPESEIIAFLAEQQESSSSITKNIYVKLGVVDYPESERYEYVSFPLEEEDQHEFECSPGSTPDPETPEGNTCDHNWVQLWEGGPKWATMNVGASSETDAGNYYMWGSTDATATCLWNYYPYKGSNKNTAPYTKYGYASDGLIELEAGDDAATKEWGCGWRTPTKAEMDDLKVYCNYTYDAVNRGIRFTSKSNGQSIFLRSAGYKGNGSNNGTTVFIDTNGNVSNVGRGKYLTATSTTSPGSVKYNDCYYLYWYTKSGFMTLEYGPTTTTGDRCTGMSVRAVHD